MNIEGLLKIGYPPKGLAADFMNEVMDTSIDGDDECPKSFATFVNCGLAVLGVKTEFAPQNVEENQVEYPADWLQYKFNPNAKKVATFVEFLEHLFAIMRVRQEETDSWPELESPVETVMQLMSLWFRECKRLLMTEEDFVEESKYAEAVAFINMHLLGLLHTTRLTYAHLYPLLHKMCIHFLSSTSNGLWFERTHRFIVERICTLLNGDDFVCFIECQAETLDVFRKALSVEKKPHTYKLIFNHLKLLIDQHNSKPHIFRILMEFLTSDEMLKIYYHNLLGEPKRMHLMPLLHLLNSLQRHLVSLDCFTQDFMSVFLEALLHTECPELAATVYISMMQKKGVENNLLVQHIMDHYLNRESDMTKLPNYVHKISQNFPYVRNNVTEYFKFITASNTDNLGSVFAARFLQVVHKDMLQSISDNIYNIELLLLKLPAFLVELECKPAKIILLGIFEITDFSVLKKSSSRFNEILNNLENYVVETFVKGNDMEYPLLHNLFTQLVKVVTHTGNKRLMKIVCDEILSVYIHYEDMLKIYDSAEELPENDTLQEYCTVFKKLCLLLTQDIVSIDQMVNVLTTLKARFFNNTQIVQLARKANSFMDLYCIEVLTKCVICISHQPSMTPLQLGLAKETVKQLRNYLNQQLESVEQLLEKPVVAIKIIYNSLIMLLIAFPHSHVFHMPLDNSTYQVLTSVLLALDINARHVQNPPISGEPTQVTPQRSLEYKKQMFAEYINLHSSRYISLPSNVVWKVISQYGRPPQTFDAELEKLIMTLAVHHFETYQQLMCMVIFTMQNAYPDSTFVRVLRAHKSLMEKIIPRNAITHFKVHIVLNVLSMSGKKIDISAPSTTNRLQILKHLPNLVNTAELENKEHRALILSHAEKLLDHNLSSVEKKYVRIFIAYIGKRRSNA